MYLGDLGDCLPCQQAQAQRARARGVSGPYATPYISVGALGQTGPAFDMKRDLIAGGVALAVPFGYDKLAPKKWPKLNLWKSVGASIATYFVVVWAYGKVA